MTDTEKVPGLRPWAEVIVAYRTNVAHNQCECDGACQSIPRGAKRMRGHTSPGRCENVHMQWAIGCRPRQIVALDVIALNGNRGRQTRTNLTALCQYCREGRR